MFMRLMRLRLRSNIHFIIITIFAIFLTVNNVDLACADVFTPILDNKGVLSPNRDSFLDPNVDYGKFYGRLTDRNADGHIFRIKSENNNIKFFRVGDEVSYFEPTAPREICKGNIRDVEDYYIVLYVKDSIDCRRGRGILRIGSLLNLTSEVLRERIVYASYYRTVLLKMHKDFLQQLSEINQMIESYPLLRVKLESVYDKKIDSVKLEKNQAIDRMYWQKKENIRLQQELMKKLDLLDENIKFYQIAREEYLTDRWHYDQDTGMPMGKEPQDLVRAKVSNKDDNNLNRNINSSRSNSNKEKNNQRKRLSF